MNGPSDELITAPWRTALIMVAVAAVLIGLAQPQTALRSAALIAIVATAIAASSAVTAVLGRVEYRRGTRLAKAPTARPPKLLPTNLSDLLRGYDHSGDLTWPVRSAVTLMASERLGMRGLQLRSPQDGPGIRAVISPLLWEVVRPARTEQGGEYVPHAPIPMHMLSTILDELDTI